MLREASKNAQKSDSSLLSMECKRVPLHLRSASSVLFAARFDVVCVLDRSKRAFDASSDVAAESGNWFSPNSCGCPREHHLS
jgi:hypothetical protein